MDVALCGWSPDLASEATRDDSRPVSAQSRTPPPREEDLEPDDELFSSSSATVPAVPPEEGGVPPSAGEEPSPLPRLSTASSVLLATSSVPGAVPPTFGSDPDHDAYSDNPQSSIAPTAVFAQEGRLHGRGGARGRRRAAGAPVTVVPDGWYFPRKRPDPSVSYATPEDEYHDDDDPGYRIREVSEEELLQELSQRGPMFPDGYVDDFVPSTQFPKKRLTERAEDPNIRNVPWTDYVRGTIKKKGKGASLVPGVKYVTEERDSFYPVDMNEQVGVGGGICRQDRKIFRQD